MRRLFCSIAKIRRFEYGQDSLLRLNLPLTSVSGEINTIWEDHTEIETGDWLQIVDNGKEINCSTNQAHKSKESLLARIPEYSNLTINSRGTFVHKDTHIDAKLKGDLTIVSDDESKESNFEFRRVKNEFANIRLAASNFLINKYWEVKNLSFSKSMSGIVDIKRFGVSNLAKFDLIDTKLSIASLFTNHGAIDHNGDLFELSMKRGEAKISIFKGSIKGSIIDANLNIGEGTFDHIDINALNSKIDIYVNEIRNPSKIKLQGCTGYIRVNPIFEIEFARMIDLKLHESEVEIVFEESQGNLFRHLTQQFAKIKKEREQEI